VKPVKLFLDFTTQRVDVEVVEAGVVGVVLVVQAVASHAVIVL
jgi:hypothetical protein